MAPFRKRNIGCPLNYMGSAFQMSENQDAMELLRIEVEREEEGPRDEGRERWRRERERRRQEDIERIRRERVEDWRREMIVQPRQPPHQPTRRPSK